MRRVQLRDDVEKVRSRGMQALKVDNLFEFGYSAAGYELGGCRLPRKRSISELSRQ
jgi:hypothetical protein